MHWLSIVQYATMIAAVLSVASVLRQRDTISTLKDNNSALREEVDLSKSKIARLEEETKQCLISHVENEKKIAQLQKQIETYKDLALVPKELVASVDHKLDLLLKSS